MTRAAPQTPPSQAPYEVTLTCRRTCNTWFLELHPGTDAAAWIAEHTGKRPVTTQARSASKTTPQKPTPTLPPLKAKLYAAVAERPGTSHEIAARTGTTVSSVRGRLCEMLTAGLLLRADGVYRVAP